MQVEIDGEQHEVAPCPFCGGKPAFVERAGDAFGFRCTCGGKRHVHTYYNPNIQSRTGRIESAVAAWNCRPPVAVQ